VYGKTSGCMERPLGVWKDLWVYGKLSKIQNNKNIMFFTSECKHFDKYKVGNNAWKKITFAGRIRL
jgi:hypothetical protein